MAFNPDAILAHRFEKIQQSYSPRDAILYALGLGLGADPTDEKDLAYLLETGLSVLPSMGVTLCSPGMWIRDPKFGVTFSKLVHSAQATEFHADLPPGGTVTATPNIVSLTDRGEGKGAVLTIERTIQDAVSGVRYVTTRQTLLLRGDGGFGGDPTPKEAAPSPTDRAADHQWRTVIDPRAALIYRLSGDWNPLHSDPSVARKAGFERPILHGLATYGIATVALMRATDRPLKSASCRFSGVVFPGDAVNFSIWTEGDQAQFEAHVGDRKVLDRGVATLASVSGEKNKAL